MFLIRFLRLFTGYVKFRAYGGFGERFLNLCSQNGIDLWDVEAEKEIIYASVSIEGYRKIRFPAKKSGMTTKIIKKYGLPFFVFRHRKRIGIPIGILIFIISLSFLSTRIWLIDVEGNNKIPEETIISAAEESGLTVGCSAIKFDPIKASLLTANKLDGISEISVNIRGSSAVIKVKEREKSPSIIDSSGMYNLVASKDAQLIILEPYCGTVQAKRFNTVLKGEVLISGIVENRDLSASYVHASGYAVGRSDKNIKSKIKSTEKFKKINHLKKRLSLYILGIEIPLGKAEKNSDFIFRKEKFLSFSKKKMPVGIIITEYSSVESNSKKTTEKEAEAICIERYMNAAKGYCETRQIISKKDKEFFDKKDKTVSGKFTCYENIGEEKSFSIEESSPSE